MPRVISIHSYRGGTGKSNFTANLAVTVAMTGKRVGVVDTDIQSPGIHNIFNLDVEKLDKTLNNFLWGQCPIEDVAYNVTENINLQGDGQLFLLPSSMRADDISRILSEGYNVKMLNEGFRQIVKSLQLDYLFIDTHPGLSKETFLSIAICHVLVLILRPDKQDYQGTAVTIDVAKQLKVRQILLVVNKALKSMNFDALRQKIETTYAVPVGGIFPLSEDVVQLASQGVFSLEYPGHYITEEFKKVAQQLS